MRMTIAGISRAMNEMPVIMPRHLNRYLARTYPAGNPMIVASKLEHRLTITLFARVVKKGLVDLPEASWDSRPESNVREEMDLRPRRIS